MNLLSLGLMAVALSMDAFALSVVRAMTQNEFRISDALTTAAFFGAAQALMPILGFYCAMGLADDLLRAGGRLVSAVILALIGIRMLLESRHGSEVLPPRRGAGHYRVLVAQAIATSLDALAAGVGLCAVQPKILVSAAVIGAVTLFLSMGGYLFGAAFSSDVGCPRALALGGVILLVLAIKTLVA